MMPCYEEGFRLADAVSQCSMRSKARIDTLFEDTRSMCSSTVGGWCAGNSNHHSLDMEKLGMEEQIRANGAVQARIEAMFASVEAETGIPGKSAAAILPVKYMGAAPVGGRVASVRGLQEPLRQLLERVDQSMNAELEISRRGLTFRTSEINEKINPFRRIAIWSAVRLRCKVSQTGELFHAFLPLMSDDQSSRGSDDKHADLYRSMNGLKSEVKDYPPIFAVVMRRPGVARLLECHAFACKIEEDAVAAAATLYRALLADLDANRRRPRQTNGLGCVSLASVASSVADTSIIGPRSVVDANGRYSMMSTSAMSTVIPGYPVRPPRSKKNSSSGSNVDVASVRSAKIKKSQNKAPEVKAEDILEARSRKLPPSNSRVTPLKELRDVANVVPNVSGHETSQDIVDTGRSSKKLRNNRARNVERNNFRNRMTHQENKVLTRSNEKSDELLSAKNDADVRRMNDYEKLSKFSASCDYGVDPEVHYSFVERNGTIVGGVMISERNEDCYERNRGSYEIDTQETRRSKTRQISAKRRVSGESGSNCSPGEEERIATPRNAIYGSNKAAANQSNRDKIYEEHFKDADKIYSLETHDPRQSEKRQGTRSSHSRSAIEENFSFSKSAISSCGGSVRTRNVTSEAKIAPRKNGDLERPSRINTLDKPIKNHGNKESTVNSKYHDSSNVRKRTRAGSEPPFSRTENAMKKQQDSKLKRSQSDLEVERGDPMTRVELPRRGSFLKPGNSRLPNNIDGGTPLGFTELFDEFRNQEGLTSVDDILAAIIDPEGMSFNDLKPLYKEFLLKLAATLTQDELYQRSASIMRRRRRPQRRRSARKPGLLGRAIRRSVSRLKGGGPTEFTSVIFRARKLNDSFDSSSSCDARNNRKRVLASRLSRRRSSWKNTKTVVGQTTSEDSDTGRRLARVAGANRSSSGYVSCSECSYDSESCTCVSADKCYCSLSRKVPAESVPNNTVVCGCDTDSCSDSNKCYCARRSSTQPTILEQLRQRGIVPSESTLSRAGSPDRTKASKTSRSHASSKSLEFLKIRPSPGRSSSDNLALDYDLFSPGKKSTHSSAGSEKVLVVSARDPNGRLVYVGGGDRDKKSFDNCVNRNEANHEALSIKKSAEIAAVFGTDSVRACRRASSISSVRSSVSLEAGLGYLP